MHEIDVFIPASVSVASDEKEVEKVRKNYSELHRVAGVKNKAFIKFKDKPMLQYILETLDKCDHVKSITLLGQTKETFPFDTDKPLYYIPGGNSTFDTTIKAIEFYNSWDQPPKYVMNISSDVPLIQPEMISRMVESIDESNGKEFYWNLIIAEDIMRYYPEISKVPFQLKEANFRFGDLHILSPDVIKGREETLEVVMGNRKSVKANIKLFSVWLMIKYFLKRLTVDDIKKRMDSQFNLNAAMMITEFPEPCIDLDYAKDLDNFKRWLSQEPRKLGDKENVVLIENHDQLQQYLKSRHYKKGHIPE